MCIIKIRSQFVFEGNLYELIFKEEQLLTPNFGKIKLHFEQIKGKMKKKWKKSI